MKHSFRFAKTVEDLFKINYYRSVLPQAERRHSYLDWFLIPEERYMIAPADVKSVTIDIPGSNGVLDLTETLTGASTFKSIEGTLSFYIDNDKILTTIDSLVTAQDVEIFWVELYRDICAFLHGKERYMLVEDDPQWYYKGRFSVGKYDASDGKWSQLKIDYILEPFKRLPWRNDKKWYFDGLNLNKLRAGTGGGHYYCDIEEFMNMSSNIAVDTLLTEPSIDPADNNKWTEVLTLRCGEEPVVPTIKVKKANASDKVFLKYVNSAINMPLRAIELIGKDPTATSYEVYDRQIIFTNYNANYYSAYDLKQADFRVWLGGIGTVTFDYDIGVI